MSPITIVCLPARVNAAQDVSPSGGVMRTPAAVALMSARGSETLKTPSLASSVPLAPVSSSIAAVSSEGAPASLGAAVARSQVGNKQIRTLAVNNVVGFMSPSARCASRRTLSPRRAASNQATTP